MAPITCPQLSNRTGVDHQAGLMSIARFFIEAHPIRIGVGEWTAVTGLFANGSTMATIARWENDQIAEEYLFFLDVG